MNALANQLSQLQKALAGYPDEINIDVDFYDSSEKTLLQGGSSSQFFKSLPKRISVSTPDFFAYYLFYKKHPGKDGYSNFQNVSGHWIEGLIEIYDEIDLSKSRLRQKHAQTLNRGITERLGEAVGLSVSSELFGMHQADWDRIPESNERKTLDYSLPATAASNSTIYQVETKGSSTSDNRAKSASMSNQKRSIQEKKVAAVKVSKGEVLLIGTVAAFDARKGGTAKCYLVDPPAVQDSSPLRMKILNRYLYLASLISLISPRSILASSLQTRLASLVELADFESLDGIPLIKGNGAPFSFKPSNSFGVQDAYFANKSTIRGETAAGKVVLYRNDLFFFIGFEDQIVEMATQQKFASILEYAFPSRVEISSFDCVLSTAEFRRVSRDLPGINEKDYTQSSANYVTFNLEGLGMFTTSGLVIGIIGVPERWRETSLHLES